MSQQVTATAKITEVIKENTKGNGRPYQVCMAMITNGPAKGTKVLATRTLGKNAITGRESSPVKVGDDVTLYGRVYENSLRFDIQKQQTELANTSDNLFKAFGLKKTTAAVGAEAEKAEA